MHKNWRCAIKLDISNWIIVTEKAKTGFFARACPAQGPGKRWVQDGLSQDWHSKRREKKID